MLVQPKKTNLLLLPLLPVPSVEVVAWPLAVIKKHIHGARNASASRGPRQVTKFMMSFAETTERPGRKMWSTDGNANIEKKIS
jgi:hypothetical protein